jgi:RsiW-degrading membrane proteinase PrsW (M82 family)
VSSEQPAPERSEPPQLLVRAIRYGMPLVIAAFGVVLCILGHGQYTSVFANRDSLLSAMGVLFIIISMMIYLFNWLMRLSAESEGDRVKEQEARDHFIRTGHWPGDS